MISEPPEHVPVLIKRLDRDMAPPRYARALDAGADLATTRSCDIAPGERVTLPTGIAIALPPGWVGLVHPRSGLAARHGLTIVNAPGTVDAGYRGEIMVCLLNTDATHGVHLERGDLIAQLVIQRVAVADFTEVSELPRSERGAGGYGSTGGIRGWQEAGRPPAPTEEWEQ